VTRSAGPLARLGNRPTPGPWMFAKDPSVELVEVLHFDGHAQGTGHEPLLVTLVSHPVAGLHDDVLTVRKQFLAQPPEMVAEGLPQ
jgi:hypothetical protein